ncbi:hypothetical protein RYX41_13820 [Lactiplantibacillus plantarum]|nr:hypothetical protein [Lactiplantibacillus plantarum]
MAVAALLLQSGASLVITSAAIAIGLFVFKYLHYLSPTNEVIQKIKQAYNKSWLIQFINKRPMGSQRNSTITGMRYGFGS